MSTLTGPSAAELFQVPRPPANTRERIVHTAIELFYRYGFHAVGLDQIIGEVGVSKQTFYNHFESKDDLIIEALATREQWEADAWGRMVDRRAGSDPRARLLAHFDVLHEWFTSPEFRGCLFLTATTEFPAPHDPVHKAAAHHMEVMEQELTETARAAGAPKPEELADQLIVLMKGALTVRQTNQNDHAAATAKRIAERLVNEATAG